MDGSTVDRTLELVNVYYNRLFHITTYHKVSLPQKHKNAHNSTNSQRKNHILFITQDHN